METLTKEVEVETKTAIEQESEKQILKQTNAENSVVETQQQSDAVTEKKKEKTQQVSIFDALKNNKQHDLPQENNTEKSLYLQSFENKTVADIMEEKRKKEAEEFAAQKEMLIQKVYEKKQESTSQKQEIKTLIKDTEASQAQSCSSEKTIEKPNFDLMEDNKKVVKLFKNTEQKRKKSAKSKKVAGLALACTLAGCGIVCVANTVIIENMNKSLLQIDETYNLNLQKYLKEITKLDQTNRSLEFLDTYPDDLLDAGDLGQKSNWFDKLCNFFGGMFGG